MGDDEVASNSVAARIAALQNKGKIDQVVGRSQKPQKNKSISNRIAALEKNVHSPHASSEDTSEVEGKMKAPGKIKPPPGAVPIMVPFGVGMPPSLQRKKEVDQQKTEDLPGNEKDADDALLTRPTIGGGKRRPRKRT